MTTKREAERAAIAASLSKHQRETICWPHRAESILIMVWSYPRTMIVLERLGLLGQRHGGWFELSPLGLAVRQHLQEQSNDK